MPRYGIEYKKKKKKYSRETDAKTKEEADAKIKRFNLQEASSHEILHTQNTDIVK